MKFEATVTSSFIFPKWKASQIPQFGEYIPNEPGIDNIWELHTIGINHTCRVQSALVGSID